MGCICFCKIRPLLNDESDSISIGDAFGNLIEDSFECRHQKKSFPHSIGKIRCHHAARDMQIPQISKSVTSSPLDNSARFRVYIHRVELARCRTARKPCQVPAMPTIFHHLPAFI